MFSSKPQPIWLGPSASPVFKDLVLMRALVKQLEIDLVQTVVLLSIYPRVSVSQYRDTCSSIFIAGVFHYTHKLKTAWMSIS